MGRFNIGTYVKPTACFYTPYLTSREKSCDTNSTYFWRLPDGRRNVVDGAVELMKGYRETHYVEMKVPSQMCPSLGESGRHLNIAVL